MLRAILHGLFPSTDPEPESPGWREDRRRFWASFGVLLASVLVYEAIVVYWFIP